MIQPALLALLSAINLAVTFGYQWLPIVKLGVGVETDALFVSTLIPQLILAVVSANLTSVLTPLLATSNDALLARRAWTFAQGIAIGAVAVNGLLFVTAPHWVMLVVPGFDVAARSLATHLVRVQLIGAVFTMLLMVTWSASYARQQFMRVEATGAAASVAGLIIAWLTIPSYGVHAVAWALVLRAMLQVLLLVPALGCYAWPDWAAVGGREVLRRLVPLMGGSLYYKADPLVERVLASFAPAGQLSLLHLAQQIYSAGNQMLTRALINPIMPTLARQADAGRWVEFRHLLRQRLHLVLALATGGWLLLLVAGRATMDATLGLWLDPAQVELLHALLVALVGVWLGGTAGQVFTVAFYAYGNTMTPTRVGVIGFSLAVPLKVLLFWLWGVLGLAVATSLYTLGNACAHGLLLRRDIARVSGAAAVPST